MQSVCWVLQQAVSDHRHLMDFRCLHRLAQHITLTQSRSLALKCRIVIGVKPVSDSDHHVITMGGGRALDTVTTMELGNVITIGHIATGLRARWPRLNADECSLKPG
jgi:hypothetical protein